MNHKQRYDFNVANGIIAPCDLEVVESLVNRLIENLYKPVESDLVFVTDRRKIEQYGIDGEPINYGDLRCNEVVKSGEDFYWIIIDEASPDECPNICQYITKYMKAWGWNVRVKTEW